MLITAEPTQYVAATSRCFLDVWPHIDPRFGGVGPAAAALARAVQDSSAWKGTLLAICNRNESERHEDIPESVQIIVGDAPRPFTDLGLIRPLKTAVRQCDICHVHGIWLAHSLAVTRIAQQLGKPIVSSVHGMLEAWELANKKLKKEIYSHLFERHSLARSGSLRALSEQEAEEYRRFGLKNPVAIVPNGVSALSRVDVSSFLAEFPELNGKPIVLFLGRIHRKKGIFNLVRSWPAVVRRHSDAHLLVAGPDYENAGAVARQMVSDLGIQNNVTFCGVLNGTSKLAALSLAKYFVLPSYSEGMSIAVLEALSIGLPVIITQACNVTNVIESGAGYVTTQDCAALAGALCDALSLTGREWQAMSESARLLARSRYSWSTVGQAMRSVYEWLLGGPKPDCVIS